jgi:hypothetical protein
VGRSPRTRASFVAVVAVVGATAIMPAQAAINDMSRTVADEAAMSSAESLPELSQAVAEGRRQSRSSTLSLSAAASPEDCVTVGGDEALTVLRYAGANRYETAVCVSFWAWPDHDDPDSSEFAAEAVVLARGDLFPDALAGGPLAADAEGPLLLTPPTALHPATAEEIGRVLAPDGLVYLLGGTSAISAGVEQQLNAAGYQTQRLAGSNRFQTSLAIADELPDTSNFFFATGLNFPDALAAGTAAAALTLGAKLDEDPETRPFAVLLTADHQMPTAVADFAWERGGQHDEWTLLTAGGQADAAAVAEFGTDNLAGQFVGADRYETTTLIADAIYTDTSGELVGDGVGLATGINFPDALAASAYLAWFANPLLLTGSTLSGPTAGFLADHAGEGSFLEAFGGTRAVSQPVLDAAEAAFGP